VTIPAFTQAPLLNGVLTTTTRTLSLATDTTFWLSTENGHDFPLHVTLPGGNESDFTLSLNALDRFIKAASENGLNMHIHYFCSDGHHDSYAHYHYLARNTDKYKTISNQRSATERLNSVIDSYNIDHRHRNADYVLIRLTLINIVIHAHIRHTEAVKKSSQDDLFEEALEKVGVTLPKEADKAA
jgi:hypothetical protein